MGDGSLAMGDVALTRELQDLREQVHGDALVAFLYAIFTASSSRHPAVSVLGGAGKYHRTARAP